MLWHTSKAPQRVAPQRLAPRGEVAMTCAGRPGCPTGSDNKKYDLGRWRS